MVLFCSSGANVHRLRKMVQYGNYLNSRRYENRLSQVNGKWYYAYGSGALAVNTTVDGYVN